MFSETEQKAIQEKFEQLRRVKEGRLNKNELVKIITNRRVTWIKKNIEVMLKKYAGLPPEEIAYRIIFFDHMNINPKHSKMIRVSPTKIRINSYNFCPYLEASKKLEMETRFVCKELGEPSVQEMLKIINPNLMFSRNYNNIRPYNRDFCEEYIGPLTKL